MTEGFKTLRICGDREIHVLLALPGSYEQEDLGLDVIRNILYITYQISNEIEQA